MLKKKPHQIWETPTFPWTRLPGEPPRKQEQIVLGRSARWNLDLEFVVCIREIIVGVEKGEGGDGGYVKAQVWIHGYGG